MLACLLIIHIFIPKRTPCFHVERFTAMISLILIAASILTSALHIANCVNLCLISGDGGLEGIIDQSGSP